jgi:hypothetical protein
MAYTKYSLTPASNNAAPPNGAPEGMLPSAVNDTMRDMMAQIRDVGDGIRDGTYTMTAPVITGGSITGVALTGNTFTNPVISGGSINNTPIGATTASTGAFSTLSVTGATTFSGATVANTFSSSGATITGGSISGITDLAVADGGTGRSTLTANAVLIGDGTSGINSVAPGTSGNVLTSDGTSWTSTAPPSSGVTSLNGQTGAITNTNIDAIGNYVGATVAVNSGATQSVNSTVAGSSLRYNFSGDSAVNGIYTITDNLNGSRAWTGGGSSLSGTWRCVSSASSFNTFCGCNNVGQHVWQKGIWVRIS